MGMEYKNRYLPEGLLLHTSENQAATASITALMQAQADGICTQPFKITAGYDFYTVRSK